MEHRKMMNIDKLLNQPDYQMDVARLNNDIEPEEEIEEEDDEIVEYDMLDAKNTMDDMDALVGVKP